MPRAVNLFEVVIGSLLLLIFGFSIVGLNQDSFISVDTHILVFGYVLITIGSVYPLLTIWMIIMSKYDTQKEEKYQVEYDNNGRISISLNTVESLKNKSDE